MPIDVVAVEMGIVAYPQVHALLAANSFRFIGFCAQRYDAIYVSSTSPLTTNSKWVNVHS